MFFLETNGLKNFMLSLGLWPLPSPGNVNQQARALFLKQDTSPKCVSFFCSVRWASREEHKPMGQPEDMRASGWLGESVDDMGDLGVLPRLTFSSISCRFLFLAFKDVITQSHLFSVQVCVLHPKAWQNCQIHSLTIRQGLPPGLVFNRGTALPSLQMMVLTKYFILAMVPL